MDSIRIRGARTHNLKNIDLDLPRNRLIVVTGLSGSGKSSLAFDTLYAEGQRRYVESLSAYARQFLSVMDKPDVDHIEGLSPAISIEQKARSHNPRSTVGTITEIYDYLRLLFARVGSPHCPTHGQSLEAQTISQMVDQALALPEGTKMMLLAPVVTERKGEYQRLLGELHAQGFVRARIDGELFELDEPPRLDLRRKHSIEVVVDRFRVRDDLRLRLTESFETALALAGGVVQLVRLDDAADGLTFSSKYACPMCGYSVPELQPRLFSFNNPAGACPTCAGLGQKPVFDPNKVVARPDLALADGAIRGWDERNAHHFKLLAALAEAQGFDLATPWSELPSRVQQIVLYGTGDEASKRPFEGIVRSMERRYRETDSDLVRDELANYLAPLPCPDCGGARLNEAARHVTVAERTLPEIAALPIGEAAAYFETLNLTGNRGEIGSKIIREIVLRLRFLVDVGLDYLTLARGADTLSGGEAQRIRLASQIGAGLVGVLYILDEPSIGLHQRDNTRLLRTLNHLRDLGNTVVVVEHDEDAIRSADLVVDLGPGAGVHGGSVVALGTAEEVAQTDSLTGQYLSARRRIEVPPQRTPPDPGRMLRVQGARGNNLKDISVSIPIGTLCCITGVSGSGKSTLINDTLLPVAAWRLNRASADAAEHDAIEGLEHFNKVVAIDQSPIGRTPRSNPATYTGMFNPIRELFAAVPEARSRGYTAGRFSFNVAGGRCEACKGDGLIRVEMHFLPDVYVQCDVCKGTRYNRETREIRYKGKTIDAVLDLTVEEASAFFAPVPSLTRKLQTLMDVGLAYVRLGQSATTLSGGEAQRIKLARELAKRDTGNTLYILDEPTTGLHFEDIRHLLAVLHRLRENGNTVVVIEHNLDVVKTADWIIDLGPEGGERGGKVVVAGTPEEVARHPDSHTGRYLAPFLKG